MKLNSSYRKQCWQKNRFSTQEREGKKGMGGTIKTECHLRVIGKPNIVLDVSKIIHIYESYLNEIDK